MALRRDELSILVEQLTRIGYAGQADSEDPERLKRAFFAVPEHVRAFDPNVVLVVGDRGAGKTALFRVVLELGLLGALRRAAPRVQLPASGEVEFVRGFGSSLGRDSPSTPGLKELLGGAGSTQASASNLWAAYLIRALSQHLEEADRAALAALLSLPAGNTTGIVSTYGAMAEASVVILDRLDERLERKQQWLFVGYDELDTLGGRDWGTMQRGTQGLVSYWAVHSRRWRRIRPKLFMRTDLFRRSSETLGADVAKLAGNRVELTWSDQNLYSVLLKRFVASGDELRDYVRRAAGSKVTWENDQDLGETPKMDQASDARPIVDRLIGPYMGANDKKGLAFNWLLDHVRDGLEVATPRALVTLFEKAAHRELIDRKAKGNRLLHPSSLRRALDDVSLDHVSYASHEWPWLHGVRSRLGQLEVPKPRRDVEQRLAQNWEASWSSELPGLRPPASDARELVDYLLEVGVLRERRMRSEVRVDAPDLYLAGLGLKRRGGVSRGGARARR